jgi:hypothetical protein
LAQINERVTELILLCNGTAPKYRSHLKFLYSLLYLPAASLSLGPADGPISHTYTFISINKFLQLILIWNKAIWGRKGRRGGGRKKGRRI